MMETQDDPLQSLILDDQDLARDELAVALLPYVRFTKQGQIVLEKAFDDLSTRRKVCCILLAYRVLHMLGLRDSAGVRSSDMETETGMPGGTVRPKLSELKKERIADQDDKNWTIPTHALRRAVEVVGGGS